MSFDEKVSLLNNYFYHIFLKRSNTEKAVCINSPLSVLGYNDLKVFETIEINEQYTMGCLADVLGIPMSTLTGVTDKLVNLGFIERTRSESDRRVVVVKVTDKGKQAFALRKSAHESISNDILSALTGEEQDQLLKLLNKVITR